MSKTIIGRISLFTAALITALSVFCGCKTETPSYEQYKDTRQLYIGAWNAPPVQNTTAQDYQDIADSGLNFIIDINSGAIENKLKFSEQAGIKFMMNGTFLSDYSGISAYYDHPAFMGIIGMDEPSTSLFEGLAKKQENYYASYPESLYFVNMLPCYATNDQLGVSKEEAAEANSNPYSLYVKKFNEIIDPKVLVYDGYSLLVSSTGSTNIDSGMLFNLEAVALEGQRSNKPYWAFLQTMGFGGGHRNVTEEDVRFQYYTYLAYGYTGLLHFCYWTPGGAEFPDSVYAMIERDGTKTPAYYGVKAVNEEILAFDHVLLSFKWTGTMTVLGKDEIMCNAFSRLSSPLASHSAIKSVSATENAVIGTFNDGRYDGFVLVNFTDPSWKKSNIVEMEFAKSDKILVYKHGVPEVVKLNKHKYTAALRPGEGRFIIPL